MDPLGLALRMAAGFWVAWTLWAGAAVVSYPRLGGRQRRPEGPSPADEVVTALVPARDEAERIEATVERLLAQEGVDLEVVVAEGPSRDDTRERVRRLAEAHERVRWVPVDEIPEGWLGKCWACQQAAEAARGDWLLFTDADAWSSPGLVRRALDEAEREAADHVAVYPGQRVDTLPGQAAQLVVGQGVAATAPPWLVHAGGAPAGIGHFNLLHRSAYEGAGGHAAIRSEVVDDVALGRALREHGARTRVACAPDALEADWGRTLPGVVDAMRKNAFALAGYRLPVAVILVALFAAAWALGLAGPATGRVEGLVAGAAFWAYGLVGLAQAVLRKGWGLTSAVSGSRSRARELGAALLTPLAFAVHPVILARSTWATLREGVTWRGTTYSLDQLRGR